MTDSNDHPDTDPTTGDHAADAADARWFRAAVAPVVDKPVPDAWDEIRGRATGQAPTVVHLDRTSGSGRLGARRRLALAAAAVVAVVGIGGAVVVNRDGGSDGETIVADPPTADGTGWYVPEDLPDGWELESVSTDWMDVEGTMAACPCDQFVWTSPDGGQSIGAMSADSDKFMLDEAMEGQIEVEQVVLDGGIDAHAGKAGPYQVVSWVEGDRGWQAATRTLDRAALVAAAGRVAADPTAPPIDGYQALTTSTPDLDGVRAYHSVTVLLRHPDRGISVGYRLEPYGDTMLTLLAGAIEELDPVSTDQPLHVVTIEAANVAPGGSGVEQQVVWFLGQWPGAAISAGLEDSRLATGPVAGDDIEAVLRSLRPASSDEWRAFLDTATGTVDEDARADRLSDLIVHEGDTVPGLDDDPATTGPAQTDPPNGDDLTRPASDLAVFAQAVEAARSTGVPTQDLFASTVDIGLDFETHRTIGAPNLVDPQAWVIDGDDVEQYAGRTPPFSASALLAGASSIAIVEGEADGCPGNANSPTPPPIGEGERLLSITPTDIDSCIDWFAVTLVVDEQDRIAGVHLYLREP